jgi:hypothetical protein
MNTTSYKPKWTQKHTDIVKEYERKKRAGLHKFYTFKDPDDFIAHLHKEPMTSYGFEKDEYGNTTYHMFHKTDNCGGYIP